MALTGCHVSVVTQLWIFGKFVFIHFTFLDISFQYTSSPNTPDMQNETLFNIIILGMAPHCGILFLFYYVQFTINGSLRNFTILSKKTSSDIAPM
jgi:hypothetical protein